MTTEQNRQAPGELDRKALEAAHRAYGEAEMTSAATLSTLNGNECLEEAIRAYLSALPSAPAVTLRAEIEQLRRERDAIRNETLEEAATIVENMPIQIYRDKGIGPAGRSCKPSTFDDAAEAIRNLKEPSNV